MNILKRATPWMVTLLILLGAYWVSYVWYYKPKRVISWWVSSSTRSAKDKRLDQFYKPIILLEEERLKQKSRNELLSQCQGDWEGLVQPRSKVSFNIYRFTRVRATIQGDQFAITWAESMPELVGVTWKIGCDYDAYPRYGISSNANYPSQSTIFLSYSRSSCGQELLNEGLVLELLSNKYATVRASDRILVRPTTLATTPPKK